MSENINRCTICGNLICLPMAHTQSGEIPPFPPRCAGCNVSKPVKEQNPERFCKIEMDEGTQAMIDKYSAVLTESLFVLSELYIHIQPLMGELEQELGKKYCHGEWPEIYDCLDRLKKIVQDEKVN